MSRKKPRIPMAGYPIETKFLSKDELDEYLSEDRLRCLLCGRRFKFLGGHLRQIHAMSSDDYRAKYGIPWCRGLVCSETSEAISTNSKRLVADGVITGNPNMNQLLKSHRPLCQVAKQIKASNLDEVNKDCTREWTRRRLLQSPRGSVEFRRKMILRPQCTSDSAIQRLRTIWIGKKRNGERGKMIRQDDT